MKRILIALMAMFMLVCGSQAAFAKRVVFANEGFRAITALYIHHIQEDYTSDNLLQGNNLYQGYGVTVDFTPLDGWVVIADTDTGERFTWNYVNFTNVNVMFMYREQAEYQ